MYDVAMNNCTDKIKYRIYINRSGANDLILTANSTSISSSNHPISTTILSMYQSVISTNKKVAKNAVSLQFSGILQLICHLWYYQIE